MRKNKLLPIITGALLSALSFSSVAGGTPDLNLKVVLIRHGEKPDSGDNLSCQGENRALQLPAVLQQKIGTPDYTYVPSIGLGKSTKHARMFQTVTPFAVKNNLTINSKFDRDDHADIAQKILSKKGTVLLVWEHKAIPLIAAQLGVKNPPAWQGTDFDSMWIVTFQDGKAKLSIEQEGITPEANCNF